MFILEDASQMLFGIIGLQPNFSILSTIISILLATLLLFLSALVSGSESAFFSLLSSDISALKKRQQRSAKVSLIMLASPHQLLSCIVLTNNFVGVAVVVLISYIFNSALVFSTPIVGFVIEIVFITFLLLFFGEIMPKIFGRYVPLKYTQFVAIPLYICFLLTRPFNALLVGASRRMNRHIKSRSDASLSMDDLSNALKVTHVQSAEDKKILKGIVKLGNIDVREIMTPRIDVVGVEIDTAFDELCEMIVKWEYSRMPVYEESFDNVKGVLYTKDLLKYLNDKNFAWQALIRPAYFVPENKKLNDLLEEFQQQKNHLAVVVDEYGGTFGIVTLEDILEEIVGEISDESDYDESMYKKQSDGTYIFEGKTLLNDFCKVMHLSDTFFNDIEGDAETLAGILLELKGNFPMQGEKITYKTLSFTVVAFEGRRVQKILVVV
ncbi:MAG: gliding motility-associated protein GldE [Bacteroidales bacterium]